ncbi:hypothetical protein TWF281_001028 [Arthrobotrys megalospora]
MHSSGLIATTAARGCILPVARQIDHIWIPDSLVKNVFRTFTLRWMKSSRNLLVARRSRVGRHLRCCHGFHTNRSSQTSQKSNTSNGTSNHGADGLFSWGSQLKGPLSFDYSRLSGGSPDVKPSHGFLNSAKVKADKKESPWLLAQRSPAKPGTLVGFPPQVPYSVAKSPSEPWILAPRDRLSELIQHDNLPPARNLRSSSHRSAIVEQQVHDILRDLLGPLMGQEIESRHIKLDTEVVLETVKEHTPSSSLQLVPYSQRSFALTVNYIDPDLRHGDTITNRSQFLQTDEHKIIAGIPETAKTDEFPTPIVPSTPMRTDSIPPIIEPTPSKSAETSTPARVLEEAALSPENVDAPADPTQASLLVEAEEPLSSPNLVIEHAAIIDTPPTFVQTIYWDGLNLPLQPPKLLLPKEARLDMLSLPTLDVVQSELLDLVMDDSISMETRVLIYSQIDTIYGLENLPDPKSFLDAFLLGLNRLGWKGVIGPDSAVWLSTHRSILRLQLKGLLSSDYLEEHMKSLTAGQKGYRPHRFQSRVLDDPFRNPNMPIHSAWGMAKEYVKQREKVTFSKYPALPLASAKIFLEKIIKLLHSGTWNSTKSRAVVTGLDIFKYCFGYRAFRPALLFSELARFLMAWKRHWSTPEFVHLTSGDNRAGTGVNGASEPKNPEPNSLPNIPELDKLFEMLPRKYAGRLVCTLLLHTIVNSDGTLSEAQYLRKIMTAIQRNPMVDVRQVTYRNEGYLSFLNDPSLYEKKVALEGHHSVARFLQGSQDIDIISFHLRTWPACQGVRYIDDRELLDRVQEALEEVINRIQARISKDAMSPNPRAPGLPFAQAILSLFYLNLPTEGLIVGIFLTLNRSKKVQELKSCLNILSHFEGKYNGQVKFKIPKQANSIALNCFRENHLPWALELLMHYHNRHNTTFANVILAAADKYPTQAETVFNEFLKPLRVTSLWNSQISFQKPAGWPSEWFLRSLAVKYALSNHHYPTKATRRIIRLRHLYGKYGYGVSMQITRALVATAMIRTATHRLWTGQELTSAEDLFKHGRLKFVITTFMKDADKSSTYLAGLTKEEAMVKKKEFIERCIKEVWEEIFKWKKYRFAVATEKRNTIKGII